MQSTYSVDKGFDDRFLTLEGVSVRSVAMCAVIALLPVSVDGP